MVQDLAIQGASAPFVDMRKHDGQCQKRFDGNVEGTYL
jgi:hypothetical protein